jgi:plastocyanin
VSKTLSTEKLEPTTMTQPTTKQWSAEKLLLVVGIVAIAAGAAVGTSVGYAVHYAAPTTRAFYLFNNSLPFDQHTWGIPHDTFAPDRITVNKGDKVVIYYRNIEDTTESHTFTMDTPYTFDAVVHAGQNETFPVATTLRSASNVVVRVNQTATITFTANWAGVFRYYCAYHQPTMTGYLVVLG